MASRNEDSSKGQRLGIHQKRLMLGLAIGTLLAVSLTLILGNDRIWRNEILAYEMLHLQLCYDYSVQYPDHSRVLGAERTMWGGRKGYYLWSTNTSVVTREGVEPVCIGWTNSIMGTGCLLLSAKGAFFWVDESTNVWRVRSRDIAWFPRLWFLREPLLPLTGATLQHDVGPMPSPAQTQQPGE